MNNQGNSYWSNLRKAIKGDRSQEKKTLTQKRNNFHIRRSLGKKINGLEKEIEFSKASSGIIRHEMKTPLNAIVGFSGLLQEGDVSEEEMKKYGGIINSSGNLLNRMVEIYGGTANNFKEKSSYFSLEDVANEIINPISHKLKESDLTFSISGGDKKIFGFRPAITVVMNTLLGNAFNYAPTSSTIDLSYVLNEEDLDASIVNKTNGNKYRKIQGDGNGEGIPYSRRVIEIYGGNASFKEENGKYISSFSIPLKNITKE